MIPPSPWWSFLLPLLGRVSDNKTVDKIDKFPVLLFRDPRADGSTWATQIGNYSELKKCKW